MEIIITTRRTKRQGRAFDLDYRWRGRRYRPLLGFDLTPPEAQQRAIDMIQKIQATALQHAQAAQKAPTVRDLIPLFWKIFDVKKRIDRTRPRGILENHLLSCHQCAQLGAPCLHRFGHRDLASLKPEDGLHYIEARMEEGASAGTIRREWQVLTRLLNLGVKYEKLDRNPLQHVDLPPAEKRTRVAEADELEALRTIKEKDPSKQECRHELWRIIQVALNVGLREGKILAIERSWIKKRADGHWLCLPPAASRIRQSQRSAPEPDRLARPDGGRPLDDGRPRLSVLDQRPSVQRLLARNSSTGRNPEPPVSRPSAYVHHPLATAGCRL
jgi:integrase